MRDNLIDICKGVVMCLVVLMHTELGDFTNLGNAVNGFHMPFFFYISGLFFFPSKYSYGKFVIRRAKRLLTPVIFFTIINVLFLCLLTDYEIKELAIGFPNAIWFLLSLFLVNMISYPILGYVVPFINKRCFNDTHGGGNYILLVGLFLLSLFFKDMGMLPFSLQTVVPGVLFFCIGNMLYAKYESTDLRSKYIIIGLLCYILLLGLWPSRLNMYLNIYNPWYIAYPSSLIGTVLLVSVVKSYIIPYAHLDRIFLWICKNSVTILCVHQMYAQIFKYQVGESFCVSFIGAILQFLFTTIFTYLTVVCVNKMRLRWISVE